MPPETFHKKKIKICCFYLPSKLNFVLIHKKIIFDITMGRSLVCCQLSIEEPYAAVCVLFYMAFECFNFCFCSTSDSSYTRRYLQSSLCKIESLNTTHNNIAPRFMYSVVTTNSFYSVQSFITPYVRKIIRLFMKFVQYSLVCLVNADTQ